MKLKNIKIWLRSLFMSHFYDESEKVELILSECIKSGISHSLPCEKWWENQWYKVIKFNNNVIYKFWDASKYSGWLKRGEFIFPNPELNFKYDECRPSYITLIVFRDALKEALKDEEEQLLNKYKGFLKN